MRGKLLSGERESEGGTNPGGKKKCLTEEQSAKAKTSRFSSSWDRGRDWFSQMRKTPDRKEYDGEIVGERQEKVV